MEKKKRTPIKKNLKKKGGDPLVNQNVILVNHYKPQVNINNFPKFEYEGGDGFSCVKVILQPNQSIRADGGTMNYMTNDIKIETKSGNIWGALGRTISGSSFFYNLFINKGDKLGMINFSGINPGNIGCFYIKKGESFNFVSNSYICSTTDLIIEASVRFGGLITGYGITYVKANAANSDGLIWIGAFGSVITIILKKGERIKVDNGVLLAFHGDIQINTKTVGGLFSTLFSQEGLVSEIINNDKEESTLYLDSRSKDRYIKFIADIAKQGKK